MCWFWEGGQCWEGCCSLNKQSNVVRIWGRPTFNGVQTCNLASNELRKFSLDNQCAMIVEGHMNNTMLTLSP